MKVKIHKLKCCKCEHQWTPRKVDVRQCPKCRTIYFDVPKKEEVGEVVVPDIKNDGEEGFMICQ